MKRKICVITGSRAEYGLLRWVIQGIKDDSEYELNLIATGMHLSPEFGLTYREIEQDGFNISRKVEMLSDSDTTVAVTKSMGIGMIGFADALNEIKPELIIVLGDRYEIFSAVSAALVARIPVAHIHGGETTEGAFDEALRHSITKMSHMHFVATEEYRLRVIQLGEQPERVFLVGGLGVDNIRRLKLLIRVELEEFLEIKFQKKNLLITFHPVTLEMSSSEKQMVELLAALGELKDTQLIFTHSNADTENKILFELVENFVSQHKHAKAFTSLGQLKYLSCIQHVDGVIGNSSSGLLEVPSFKKGTINVGDRQLGRLKASSVIDCEPDRKNIAMALERLYSLEFQSDLINTVNPYGEGGASEKVLNVIRDIKLDGIIKKKFYDVPPATNLGKEK